MQQLCRQHGFHSKHLRLKQYYSVYYYYHIMSAYRLFYQSKAVMTQAAYLYLDDWTSRQLVSRVHRSGW